MVLDHKFLNFVEHVRIKTLIESLSMRIDIALTLLDADTGTIIFSTGNNDSEWFANHCWPALMARLSLLPIGVPEVITHNDYPMLCSRYSLAGMELVLLTGSYLIENAQQRRSCPCPTDAVAGIWPSLQQIAQITPNFELIQHLVWQYLQGQISAHYEQIFITMVEKMELPSKQLTTADYHRHIAELAAIVPGVALVGLRAVTPAGTGKLVAWVGNTPENMPEELPLAGIWGKCLHDGKVRPLGNLAEDPGVPSYLAGQLSQYSAIYLPLGLGGEMIAVLVVAFDNREDFLSPQTRELLTLVQRRGSALATLAKAKENLLLAKRQLRGQAHLVDSLVETNLNSLGDIEAMISILWGFSWVQICLPNTIVEDKSCDIIEIPLKHAGAVIALVYAKRSEVEALGAEILDLGVAFLARFVALWRKLADTPQTQGDSPLTLRELEVAQLLAEGESNKTAAAKLSLSEKTVKTHVSNILRKLQLPDRTAIAVWFTKRQEQ